MKKPDDPRTLSEKRRAASLARKTRSGGRQGNRLAPGGARKGAGRKATCACGTCRKCYMREAKRRSRANEMTINRLDPDASPIHPAAPSPAE